MGKRLRILKKNTKKYTKAAYKPLEIIINWSDKHNSFISLLSAIVSIFLAIISYKLAYNVSQSDTRINNFDSLLKYQQQKTQLLIEDNKQLKMQTFELKNLAERSIQQTELLQSQLSVSNSLFEKINSQYFTIYRSGKQKLRRMITKIELNYIQKMYDSDNPILFIKNLDEVILLLDHEVDNPYVVNNKKIDKFFRGFIDGLNLHRNLYDKPNIDFEKRKYQTTLYLQNTLDTLFDLSKNIDIQ